MLDTGWTAGPPRPKRDRGALIPAVLVLGLIVALTGAILLVPSSTPVPVGNPTPPAGDGRQVVVVGSAPASWDPSLVGDAGSAGTLAQVFESLTTLDARNRVQPALADSWSVQDAGRQITFRIRKDATFSDGTPISAADVRRSWLRVLDPQRHTPLASLLGDVDGAAQYGRGKGSADAVRIDANGAQLVVHFVRPAAYFVSAAASPTLAIVPLSLPDSAASATLPRNLVVSGAYLPASQTSTEIRLTGNANYWAGMPPVTTVVVTTSLGGASPIDTFQAGKVDYTPIFRDDASWIQYDRNLGPQLRRNASLSVSYYGFTTTGPPFDKVEVRRAFALAVDWHRLVKLDDAQGAPATSLIPEGIVGRGTQDFSPAVDVTAARQALATAGYPGGKGFPAVTLVSSGGFYEDAVAAELEKVLGITVSVELQPFNDFSHRLSTAPPAFWTLSWVADYPHPQDFLGLLLETGSGSNAGGWSNGEFDKALDGAAATEDPAAQEQAYAEAQRIVKEQVPLIPLRYGDDWALSRTGLLGAQETGVGFLRFASLAWAGR